MTVKINGKECKLNFGVGFVRDLDQKYFVQGKSGIKFGSGLESRVPMLLSDDVVTLAEFIYLGTARMSEGRPSIQEVDDFIDSAKNIEELFEQVVEELKKSNACRVKVLQLEENIRKEEEKLKEEEKRKEEEKLKNQQLPKKPMKEL